MPTIRSQAITLVTSFLIAVFCLPASAEAPKPTPSEGFKFLLENV